MPAAATSLPEVSTGLTATELGDYLLAVSGVSGDDAFSVQFVGIAGLATIAT